MQPHDQEELRRRAQEVLRRRISMDDDSPPPRPPEVREARQPQPPPRRMQPPEAPAEVQIPEAQPEPLPFEIEPVDYGPATELEPPMARTERRQYSDTTSEPEIQPLGPRMQRGTQAGIRRVLRDREAIRRAIVLNEILGPPVSLRDEDAPGSFGAI